VGRLRGWWWGTEGSVAMGLRWACGVLRRWIPAFAGMTGGEVAKAGGAARDFTVRRACGQGEVLTLRHSGERRNPVLRVCARVRSVDECLRSPSPWGRVPATPRAGSPRARRAAGARCSHSVIPANAGIQLSASANACVRSTNASDRRRLGAGSPRRHARVGRAGGERPGRGTHTPSFRRTPESSSPRLRTRAFGR
jgi:hypothetical protein